MSSNPSNMNTWSIVKFKNENAVEAVPTGWIIGTDECYWPPWTTERLSTAIKKSEEPNSCWPSFKVECFRNSTYENYWVARSKAKKAEETSDLNSESDHQTKRIRKKRIFSSSESEDDFQIIRSPPKMKKNSEIDTSISRHPTPKLPSSSNQNITEKQCLAPAPPTVSNEVVGEPTPTSSRIRTVTSSHNSRRSECETDVCSCCPVHNNGKYLKEILQQNHLLRALIGDLLVEIRALKENQSNNITESIFNKFDFPFKLQDNFEEFEYYLRDSIIFANAITEISKLGGSSPYNFIKRAMSLLMSNELAMGYSWLRRKGKLPFCHTQMAMLLIGAADKGNLSKFQHETELAIGSWLKRANERTKKA